jgi:outer membrane lipoprotein-sorting protein
MGYALRIAHHVSDLRLQKGVKKMDKRWFLGLSLLVVISLLVVGCQSQPTAEEIVAKLKEVEASTEDAHAVLEIDIQGQGIDENLTVEVWEQKPDKFRAEVLESSDPDYSGAVTVADGQQVWMYQPSQNEVVVGQVGPDEPSSPRDVIRELDEVIQRALDTSQVNLAGEEVVAGEKTYKLELTPTESEEAFLPAGSKATLWVDQADWFVLQAEISGDLLGKGLMSVQSFELNTGLDDTLFQFEVPEGAQVTDIQDKRPTPVTLDEARAQADFPLLLPGYLPEGVTLIDVLAMEGAIILRYDHSSTSFTIIQGPAGDPLPLPPGSQQSEITLRGQTASLFSDGGPSNLLTWTENGVAVTIAGHIGQDEILEVAESLQ